MNMTDPREIRTLMAEIEQILSRLQGTRVDLESSFGDVTSRGIDGALAVVIGYGFHNFYTGLEEIFLRIAETFENQIPSDRWHAGLLQRMTIEISGIRPAVLSNDVFENSMTFVHFDTSSGIPMVARSTLKN